MYVAKTDRVYNLVQTEINALFRTRVQKAEDWTNYGMPEQQLTQAILDAIVPIEHQNIFRDMGALYFDKISEIHIDIAGSTYSFGIPPTYLPSKLRYRPNAVQIDSGPIYDIYMSRKTAMREIHDEITTFKQAFDRAWNAVPSVNALLKVWPAAENLLPNEIVQKINRKNKRYDKTTISGEIDVNGLSTHLLKAKIRS